jgi:hypothetical protein
VRTAGAPITQKEFSPPSKAWSVETRMDVAPNQDAEREKKTKKAGRFREARKKSSRFFILFENRKPTLRRRMKYPARNRKNSIFTKPLITKNPLF